MISRSSLNPSSATSFSRADALPELSLERRNWMSMSELVSTYSRRCELEPLTSTEFISETALLVQSSSAACSPAGMSRLSAMTTS